MKITITILQIAISLAIIALVAIQGKGGGLGSAFGASNTMYFKRRGVERMVFYFTILLIVLFLIVSVASLLL